MMVSIDYLSSGVYFLLQKQIVVYVGQSRNPLSRIGQHTKDSSKVFNGVKILPCDTDKTTLTKIEDRMIAALRPKYNKRGYYGESRSVPIDDVDFDEIIEERDKLYDTYKKYVAPEVFSHPVTFTKGNSNTGVSYVSNDNQGRIYMTNATSSSALVLFDGQTAFTGDIS
tara:strand:+ start:26 stop:532 length:507 start_codon:yes stop_codon:yes gene_type:complete